ncbi:MAG TPA: ABC-type transport auxiliary lipoprotein family protein [Hyphomicrobiaceae bacterium]|nr:ABC-type transport auxiliary lipoprotein family protein [Hyphomicrobiaceae bacterium]
MAGGSGCRLSKPNPTRHHYLLDVQRPTHAAPPRTREVLRVRPFRVAPAFDQRSLVYRRTDTGYESDFYHLFAADPGSLLAEATRGWLADAGVFDSVLPSASLLTSTFTLDGTVSRLYGDFRDLNAPRAVLALELTLSADRSPGPGVRLQRRYQTESRFEGTSPEALVQAWNRCLEEVFRSLEKDLQSLEWLHDTPNHPR